MNTRGIEDRITFGKHGGKPWTEVPTDYLIWLKRQMDMKLKSGRQAWGSATLYPRLARELESRNNKAR